MMYVGKFPKKSATNVIKDIRTIGNLRSRARNMLVMYVHTYGHPASLPMYSNGVCFIIRVNLLLIHIMCCSITYLK